MPYRVEDDINTMEAIQRVFDEAYFAAHTQGCEDARPVFITSLPRSGSTLTDRILSSHPDISSAGEINDLAMLITQMSVGATSKAELIRKSAALDMRELGQRYVNVLKSHDDEALRVIDKTPLNFLYFGLIAKALPNAVIIHVTRDPMDVGYAMFKTLFRMGYPFSYDLDDIAKYMGAKSRLMKHWHAMMPGRIKTVCYEDLVKTQEAASRALVSATGLDWNEACLDFHKNQSASATASAAQVRRPVYNSSLQKWKNYSDQLQPLEQALRTQGILT